MKRVAVALLLLALVLPAWLLLAPRTSPPARPSLLLITIDTLRADRVGAYGSTAGLTPAIDALAARGRVFENAVAAAPLTLPSHSTILSGLDPMHHGVRNNGTYAFPSDRETIATRLKAAGYSTAAFVGAVVLDRRYGLARGFDIYDDRIERAVEGRSVLESERPCALVVESAAAWLGARRGPYFAWVHFYEPHAPYAPLPDLAAAHPGQPYDAEVAGADRCLASLVAMARAASPSGLVVAVTGDHGEGLGEHGEATHGLFVYQSTLRVPMVIEGPGVEAGSRTPRLARSADLAPTLLALLGAKPIEQIDGRDLLAGGGGGGEAYAESDYGAGFGWAPLRSWRIGSHKLIDAPRPEFYDLDRDPGETRDLAAERPADVERLRAVLRAALGSEVKRDARRVSDEAEERLRSLGYVAGTSAISAGNAPLTDPKDARALLETFERSLDREARGDRSGAIALLKDVVRRDSRNLVFRRSLAGVLRRDHRLAESIQALRAAHALAPTDASIAHDLALSLAESGDSVQAIEWEERALAMDPESVDALDHLATLRAARGEFADARIAVERALALDANHARAWSNRGNIAQGQGLPAEAEQSYARALELSPGLVDAVNGLGVLAVQAGRFEEAAQRFTRALELEPGFDEARLNLAVTEARLGREARAVELATRVTRGRGDAALRARARSFLADLGASPR